MLKCPIEGSPFSGGIFEMRVHMQATSVTRYSFTAQFLRGGAIFAHRAHAIEATADESLSEELQGEHRAFVVGAIVQSVAALESEISEVVMHGPGHHLWSAGVDTGAREFLLPMAELIDRESTLRRYDLVLHLLRKAPFEHGAQPYQAADLLIKLRNQLIHCKSEWGARNDPKSAVARLEKLAFDKPTYMSPHTNFFPLRCLSASLASWSIMTGSDFIHGFYSRLAIACPLAAHAPHLTVPPPRPRV
jgi:hypothetical protein